MNKRSQKLTKAGKTLLLSACCIILLSIFYSRPVQRILHRDGLWNLITSVVKSAVRPGQPINLSAEKFEIKGIDVSYYQGRINWKRVKAHPAHFTFIKATQGKRRIDRYFTRNWKGAREAGLLRGAYHFFTPSIDAEAQAKNFIDNVNLEPGDLPPVLDIERTEGKSADEIREGVQVWLDKVEDEYGLVPILYTNYRFYQRYLEGNFDDYPIWIAHYTTNTPIITHQTGWTFWQHSETGRVKGISKKVDMNVFCGSKEALQNLCKR